VEARLCEIFDLVLSQVEQSRNEAKLPAGVVITGGSAMLPAITSIAKKIFGVPARIGYPKGLQGLIDEINGPAYAVSQGLIAYGANDEGIGNTPSVMSKKSKSGKGLIGGVAGFLRNLIP
jgi:cell division protein FtsA